MIASGKRRLRGLKNPVEFSKRPLACQAGPPEGGRVTEYRSPALLFSSPLFFVFILYIYISFFFLSGIGNHKMSIVLDMKSDAEWDSLIVVR